MGGVGNSSGFWIDALLPAIIDAAMAAVSSETDVGLGIFTLFSCLRLKILG